MSRSCSTNSCDGSDEPDEGRMLTDRQGEPNRASRVVSFLLSLPIHLYRWTISPLLPQACRYEPTCSRYALEALRVHGPLRGTWLAITRILRCAPWGASGSDPVPPRRSGVQKGNRSSAVITT
jgi:uncharacterized protein